MENSNIAVITQKETYTYDEADIPFSVSRDTHYTINSLKDIETLGLVFDAYKELPPLPKDYDAIIGCLKKQNATQILLSNYLIATRYSGQEGLDSLFEELKERANIEEADPNYIPLNPPKDLEGRIEWLKKNLKKMEEYPSTFINNLHRKWYSDEILEAERKIAAEQSFK